MAQCRPPPQRTCAREGLASLVRPEFTRRRGCHADEGIRGAVVEKPLALKQHEAFAEGGAGSVLSAALVGLLWKKHWLVETAQNPGGMIRAE